jgi:hypothetical protein
MQRRLKLQHVVAGTAGEHLEGRVLGEVPLAGQRLRLRRQFYCYVVVVIRMMGR